MKVGIVTDDGTTVSPHFGMAKHYLVIEIADGLVKGKEPRPKVSHQREKGTAYHPHDEKPLHIEMLSGVQHCEALVARGMGRPMYEAILQVGIKPYVTGIARTDDVVRAYIDGNLDNLTQRLQ